MKNPVQATLSWLAQLSPTCKKAVRLQSDRLDRTLPLPQRIGLAIHLLLCKWCRRYGSQIRFMRDSLHNCDHADTQSTTPQALTPEARERIKKMLEKNSQ
ncbi:MAG: zf-HC2 protein [Pedosphaera sp.]|nr:zf-HC2 protein [Pedosphaera sp.]